MAGEQLLRRRRVAASASFISPETFGLDRAFRPYLLYLLDLLDLLDLPGNEDELPRGDHRAAHHGCLPSGFLSGRADRTRAHAADACRRCPDWFGHHAAAWE